MAKLVSEGRKREFAAFDFAERDVPDPEARETLTRSRLRWEEAEQGSHKEMLEWVRSLIQLRRRTPSLNDGDKSHTKVRWDEKKRWLVMDRGTIQVILNVGCCEAEFDIAEDLQLVLASADGVHREDNKLRVPADTLTILSTDAASVVNR